MQLIHETVRDFLLGTSHAIKVRGAQKSSAQHELAVYFEANVCHYTIAKTCLQRLIFVASHPTAPRTPDFLAGYAAQYWWQHVKAAGDDTYEEVLRLATKLCLTPSYLYTWVQHYQVDRPYWYQRGDTALDLGRVAMPLYYAAYIGYQHLIEAILEEEVNVNTQGGVYGNALQAALYRGYEKVVQMLLKRKADVNA